VFRNFLFILIYELLGVKNDYMQQLQVLKDLIQDNTEKLSFLTVLEEELLKLRKTLNLKLMSEVFYISRCSIFNVHIFYTYVSGRN
jgi:cell shape-determining protein MreC